MDDAEILLNANSVQLLVPSYALLDFTAEGLSMSSLNSSAVSITQRNVMFSLLKENMEGIYTACSWGWEEKKKFAEMSHINSRFLIVHKTDDHEAIEAFAMFRFDWDDEDEPDFAVLFVYEVQVSKSLRGKGVGRLLMKTVVGLQEQYQLRKTALTCFKHNTAALSFYKSIDFGIDSNSPSEYGHMDVDYEILSNRPKTKLT